MVLMSFCISETLTQTIENGEVTVVDEWQPATSSRATVNDLHSEYSNIFRHGNRNAASHLWSTFLLERAYQMTLEQLVMFFTGFCVVSGSPIRPSDYNRYRLTLPRVGKNDGKQHFTSAYMHYCCWPCVCDTQDYIKIDTVKAKSIDGIERTLHVAVIGNPCDNPDELHAPFHQSYGFKRETSIADSAPEVRCLSDGSLEGAMMSDGGYVIIGMVFDAMDIAEEDNKTIESPARDGTPGRISISNEGVSFQDEKEYSTMCNQRAENGYNSGMGEIFRKVSAISPINESIPVAF
eukprot:CAMPEP_0194419838 /NCGR_PEP_ID=MMETSP0176-20130528/19023_1 /TAXON_ID=216777 /ORGANISM="Proboscia alata, Strain PI-D3" /LENGTH=292 /DNA_ID=CAMNT_0039227029 /DNA_START=103 /DNA_END=981 /DNA_ORIENTATION=-